MSTILVDAYGRPLTADPVGPMYGPTRFEDQPASVRRRGRKGKALRSRSASSSSGSRYWADGEEKLWSEMERRGRPARKRSASRRTSKKARKSARARNRTDYRNFLSKRAGTYGPVAFSDQPTWVRKRGRKGKALRGRKSAARTTRRSARRSSGSSGARSAGSAREVRRLRREGAITRKQARKLNRQLARTKSKAGKRSKRAVTRRSRKGSRKLSRSSGASKVLTYNSLMKRLPKGMKAWVCYGKKRTGCGGGRKGYRGSRQLGVLRP